jgi:hypothetical protein
MKLPFIFIFNLDKTIIGDIKSMYNILKTMNNKFYNIEEFKEKFIRPNFKDFIKFIKNKYKNVELYIYCNGNGNGNGNSDLNIIINRIESYVNVNVNVNVNDNDNIKFNKLYFKDDILIGDIYDTIITDLISKYPLLKIDKNKKNVFDKQFLYIDSIKDNIKDYPEKQLVCPEYNYFYYNIYIGSSYYKKLKDDNLYENILFLINQRYTEINNKNINDTFFKSLISILDKQKLLLDNNQIKEINSKIDLKTG